MCVCVCADVMEAAVNDHIREANAVGKRAQKSYRRSGAELPGLKETPESMTLPHREAN